MALLTISICCMKVENIARIGAKGDRIPANSKMM
jgi:hypothetical protein